jgi:DNA-binding beta-propeller fold protein YncE
MRCAVRTVLLLAFVVIPAVARGVPTDLADYAVYGVERVRLGARAQVHQGGVGTAGKLAVGSDARIFGFALADQAVLKTSATIDGNLYYGRSHSGSGAVLRLLVPTTPLPAIALPPPPAVSVGSDTVVVADGEVVTLDGGSHAAVEIGPGAVVTLTGALLETGTLVMHTRTSVVPTLRCVRPGGCAIHVASRLIVKGYVGVTGDPIEVHYAGSRPAVIGSRGTVKASVFAVAAMLRLRASLRSAVTFDGQFVGHRVVVASGAVVLGPATAVCENGLRETPEQCDPPEDTLCPGQCQTDCTCPTGPTGLALFSVGPSVLQNATAFGIQLAGTGFEPGAEVELYDKATNALLATLPAGFVSSTELTARVPAGMAVAAGIQRELTARVRNPGGALSGTPSIGHCQTDLATSPVACNTDLDCPVGAGACVTGAQRLTMFNDRVFLNPNSVAAVPPPLGVCDDGAPCAGAADCTDVGTGACSPKLYVTPQQVDELWVYNAGTGQFVDEDAGTPGIQGIPVGDNPFHVELLTAGGPPRAWVVNRFDDALSIVDPATDTEIARVTGAALGMPGRLRMGTEVEFNRAGTRAYVSNQNLDEVQVLDIAGANRDAPAFLATIDVGVNPRGMTTNTADTRLYVANIQTADVSVVDIAPGSPTENQVIATIAARATDDIVGGRADGWEAFVISGRAPRGIAYSDAQGRVFVTSIGPQTGPRQGVGQVGGAIINPTITVIDPAANTIVAHVALNGRDPDRFKCTDPELMALDDAAGRVYVTCQGSGVIDVLDTAALAAGLPAEVAEVPLPLPADVPVPLLNLQSIIGALGTKVCAGFTSNPGMACTSDAQCSGCPASKEGLPVECCARNAPPGLHNGPRGVALAPDARTLYVVNQFTTSVATVDVSPADPAHITVPRTTSFPGAFGADTEQRDRRLGQIEFFTDVKGTNTSCATCHIDDHQDGLFFEADVAGPRLRRVLSVRGTRDMPPLLQDQLLPDLAAFTDLVVHVERGGPICTPCTEPGGTFLCFPSPEATCLLTSNDENRQNTLYAKAITFFPNPNLAPDGALDTAVPLPGGTTGDAVRGAAVFDALACASCHPDPVFTIDQFRVFTPVGFSIQPVRMRDVLTPVYLPLRAGCQDANRPTGVDGSHGFTVPTLRGTWDTFPLLMSGAAGFTVAGTEPTFTLPCSPGSSGCCAQLQSPLNPGGTPVPPQHLAVATKDAMRAVLTPPLAVPGTGHGTALGLSATDLNDLIAYLRSL